MATHVIELAELTSADGCGAKAFRLGELLRAGFAVPPGFVIVFDKPGEPIAARDAAEIEKRAALLGDAISVRSSAAAEDRPDGSAPGLYLSIVPTSPTSVLESTQAVRASSMTSAAERYAELTRTTFPSQMAVVVGAYVQASAAGTLYIENADPENAGLDQVTIEVRDGPPLPDEQRTSLEDLGRRVGQCLGIDRLDLEWVIDEAGEAWTVQARPLSDSAAAVAKSPPPVGTFAFAAKAPSRSWHWDAAHNPLPLSIAHRGLVEWVVAHADADLAVAAGYLYETLDELNTTADDSSISDERVADDLESVFFAEVAPELDALLAASELSSLELAGALEVFSTVYRTYTTKIAPRVARAKRRRGNTRAALQPSLGAGLLATIANGTALGEPAIKYAQSQATTEPTYWFAHAPRWDIAEPCLSEDAAGYAAFCTTLVDRRRPRSGKLGACSSTVQHLADLAHAVGELDDRFFYRAQRVVRQAILDLAGDLPAADRFFLPLPNLLDWALSKKVPDNARQQIANNKKRWQRESRYAMPHTVRGTAWDSAPSVRGLARTILRGRGRGGQASGRVHRTDHPTARAIAPPPESIIVASDLSPGEIVLCAEAVGVVLETERLLGHAVAMASELGIPIVVGVPVGGLSDGELLWIDGTAGTVVRSHS